MLRLVRKETSRGDDLCDLSSSAKSQAEQKPRAKSFLFSQFFRLFIVEISFKEARTNEKELKFLSN